MNNSNPLRTWFAHALSSLLVLIAPAVLWAQTATTKAAGELFTENFEGTPTTEITRLGWVKEPQEVGSLEITRNVIDSGTSARGNGTVNGQRSRYACSFRSPYKLSDGETVTCGAVIKIEKGTASGALIELQGGGYTVVLDTQVYPANRIYSSIYPASGPPRSSQHDLNNSLDPLHLDVQITNKAGPSGGVTFSYRKHGSDAWTQVYSVSGVFMPQIDAIYTGGIRRDGPYAIDSIVLSTDSNTAKPLEVSPAEKQTLGDPQRPLPQLRDQPSAEVLSAPTEWRHFVHPSDMRQSRPRPSDEELLRILPPLRQEPQFDAAAKELGMAVVG
jgi:hypothetical protein